MASADSVNFAIRPNKAVERKLVFEKLSLLAKVYAWSECRYIGFGAMWFVDFVLAHRRLSITDMISIERNEYLASRARFNRPYACVSVEVGESDSVLPRLRLEERRLLAWLDYDASLDGPVLTDLATLCQRAPVGSVLIATINAHKGRLPDKDADDREFEGDQERISYFVGEFADGLVPQELPKGAMQTSGYPGFLSTLLLTHMRRQLRVAGREGERLLPLFNISYGDNAPMITIGAAIANEQHVLETNRALDAQDVIQRATDVPLRVEVPPLTFKEKVALDQLMPREQAPTENAVAEELGFRLKPSQIEAYHRFYRYYPMFGELDIF